MNTSLILLAIIAVSVGSFLVFAFAAQETFDNPNVQLEYHNRDIPIQPHKMVLQDQQFFTDVPINFDDVTPLAIDNKMFVVEKGTLAQLAYYKSSDQPLRYDYTTSNTLFAFCDVSVLPTEQNQGCEKNTTQGKAANSALLSNAAVMMQYASAHYDRFGSYTKMGPTITNPDGSKTFTVHKELNHNLTTLCELDADSNPLLSTIDLDKFREFYQNGMRPEYKQWVKNHLENAIVKNNAGDIQYLDDGVTPQKVHQGASIHPMCDI